MAWPCTVDVYETLTSGVTTVKAALHTLIQQRIYHVFSGTKTLVGVTVDGTGDAAATPDGLTVKRAVTTYTLMGTFADVLGMGNEQGRLYRGTNGATIVTVNASWNEATALWTPDDAAVQAMRIDFTRTAWGSYDHAAAANWNDVGWGSAKFTLTGTSGNLSVPGDIASSGGNVTANVNVSATTGAVTASTNVTATGGYLSATNGTNGRLMLGEPQSAAAGGAAQAVPLGYLYKDGCPVAWAKVDKSVGGAALVWGYNITSVTNVAAGKSDIVLENCPANALVCVITCAEAGQNVTFCYAVNLGTKTISVEAKVGSTAADADVDYTIAVFGG